MSPKINNPSNPPNLKVRIQLSLDKLEQILSKFDKLGSKTGIILTLLGILIIWLKYLFPSSSLTKIFLDLVTIILIFIHQFIPFHLSIGDFLGYLGLIILFPTFALWLIRWFNQIGSTKSK